MSLTEFAQNVKIGAYNDFDGHGDLYLEDATYASFKIYPSDLPKLRVRWYNK